MPPLQFRHILRPSIDYLTTCEHLLLGIPDMARFLGISEKTMRQIAMTNRIPHPMRFPLGQCRRWNVLELLDWVHAGCPRRDAWIAMRGRSGWYPPWSRWYI